MRLLFLVILVVSSPIRNYFLTITITASLSVVFCLLKVSSVRNLIKRLQVPNLPGSIGLRPTSFGSYSRESPGLGFWGLGFRV